MAARPHQGGRSVPWGESDHLKRERPEMTQRGEHGYFLPGHKGGPGRPSRSLEQRYLKALATTVPLREWKKIAKRALADAKDGNAQARDWLSRHLLGDHPLALAELLARARAELEELRYVIGTGLRELTAVLEQMRTLGPVGPVDQADAVAYVRALLPLLEARKARVEQDLEAPPVLDPESRRRREFIRARLSELLSPGGHHVHQYGAAAANGAARGNADTGPGGA
jgi:hypothetical protein